MIVDGKQIAEEILEKTKAGALALPNPPSFLAIAVAPSPATESYLKMKRKQAGDVGIRMEVKTFEHSTTDKLIALIREATEDAIIVQLPLPADIDMRAVLDSIPVTKDADVLGAETRRAQALMHPIAAAIQEVLHHGNVNPRGKRVVVVGKGWLVGAPAAGWLRSVGAQVEVVTRDQGELKQALAMADIVVAGAGVAGLIGKNDIKAGAAVIDIGTSELGGSIAGDVQPEVADVAGLFTPVPGGVGPITVAFLLKNVVLLAERKQALLRL